MAQQVVIDSNYITLGVGHWELVWGSVDPQQLGKKQIRIACDLSGGSMIVTLPPAATEQSYNAELFFCNVSGGGVIIHRYGTDTINGHPLTPPLTLQYQMGICTNKYGSNWTLRSMR